MIRTGCSGWSYPEWSGIFYPPGTDNFFTYYSSIFSTVEINSTFYSIPKEATVSRWIKQAKNIGFLYSVKIPSTVTHLNLSGNVGEAKRIMWNFERDVLLKMKHAGVLCAAIIQLPPYIDAARTENVYDLLEHASVSMITYAVEPRHNSLYSNASFHREITRIGAVPVSLDSPASNLTDIHISGGISYVRLHGRNSEEWFMKGLSSMEKYNYSYNPSELESIGKIIREAETKSDIYIYFNNHPNGNAPKNAMELMARLGETRNSKQRSLF